MCFILSKNYWTTQFHLILGFPQPKRWKSCRRLLSKLFRKQEFMSGTKCYKTVGIHQLVNYNSTRANNWYSKFFDWQSNTLQTLLEYLNDQWKPSWVTIWFSDSELSIGSKNAKFHGNIEPRWIVWNNVFRFLRQNGTHHNVDETWECMPRQRWAVTENITARQVKNKGHVDGFLWLWFGALWIPSNRSNSQQRILFRVCCAATKTWFV